MEHWEVLLYAVAVFGMGYWLRVQRINRKNK